MKHFNAICYCLACLFCLLSTHLSWGQIQMPPLNTARADSLTAPTTITDNGGPANPYEANSASSLTLLTRPGEVVSLSFTQFDFEDQIDFLYIFDGPNTSYPMLMCGSTGSTLPANVIGTNPLGMTIVLISDGNAEGQGFSADATLVPGGVAPDPTKTSIPYFGKTVINACTGTVYDNGGASCGYMMGSGIIDSDGHLVIIPDQPDHVVRINFAAFQTEQVPGFSPPDYLRIYDGQDTLAPVLGEFGENPDSVTADAGGFDNPSGALTLKFISDFLFSADGFEGAISCVPRPKVAILTPDTTICFKDTASIRIQFTVGTPPFKLIYETPLGRVRIDTIPTANYTIRIPNLPVGNQTFTIRQIADANLPLRNVTGNGLARVITVNNPPRASFETITTEVCNGNPANLRVNLVGNPPFTLTYLEGTTPRTVNNIPANVYTITFNPTVTTTVRLQTVRDATCQGMVTNAVNIVTVTPRPTAVWTSGSGGNVCPGQPKKLTVSFSGKAPWTFTYSDGTNNFTIPNISANPYTFTVNITVPTTFTLVSVTTPNCPPGTASGAVSVGFNVPPDLTVEPSVDCGTGLGVLTALVQNGKSPYLYSFDEGKTFGTPNTASRPIANTPYTVMVQDANGCRDTATVLLNGIPAPTITLIDLISVNTMRVQWTLNPSQGVRYMLRYRVKGSEGAWTTISGLTMNNRIIVGLQPATEYEFQAAIQCAGGLTSPWSNLAFATTLAAKPATCNQNPPPAPTNFYVNQIQARSARLNWNSVSGPGYIIAHGLSNLNPNNFTQQVTCNADPLTPQTTFMLTGLQPNSTYRARVRTNCSNCITALNITDRRSDWSNMIEWRTPATAEEDITVHVLSSYFSLYPNPNKGQFQFDYQTEEIQSGMIRITDLAGKIIWQQEETFVPNAEPLAIDLGNASAGIYILQWQCGSTIQQAKIIIE